MKRIASIALPRLAIERWSNGCAGGPEAAPEAPVVLVVEAAHGQLIHAVTAAAAERGARAGIRLTDARALAPDLVPEPADPAGDWALLKRLARWAGRWSPLVEVDPSTALGTGGADGPSTGLGAGLRLDVSGVAHLFGGEEALAADIEQRFAGLGLTARVAIAPTAGAAWALARFPSPRVEEEKGLAAALAPLPVAALRIEPRSAQLLERLGLKTIGQLDAVPRRALQRRFRAAAGPLAALDRALGRKPEPLTAEPVQPAPRAVLRLAEPATHPQAAAQALDRLVPALASELEERRLGARRLHLAGYRVDGSIAAAGVATAIATREPAHLLRLLADKAQALDPGFGVDGFVLTASWCEPLGSAQASLAGDSADSTELARLVDRLSVKLGPERVRRPAAVASHVPERASGWEAAVESSSPRSSPPSASARRPHHLLDRPEAIAVVYATPEGVPRRFVWRRRVHDIARVEGPERIAPEWWRERGTARLRDYYRVEDQAGRRFWLFREGLAGDGRGGAPLWFLHGLFG